MAESNERRQSNTVLSHSSNQITMESEMLFKVYYGGVFVTDIIAHSKWEAVEKAWTKFSSTRPLLVREKFKARLKK